MSIEAYTEALVEAACYCPRVIQIGADRFWDRDGTYSLGLGTLETKLTQGDHSAQHTLYCTVPVPCIQPPTVAAWRNSASANSPVTVLTKAVLDIEGSGFTSLPVVAARLRVYSKAGGTLLSVDDPSDLTGLNTRHAPTYNGSPIALTTGDVLIEVAGPFGGTGWGAIKIYRVLLYFATRVTIGAADITGY
jgi:hypothetical protein